MPIIAQINALEPTIEALTDDQLRAKTAEFRQRIDQARAKFDPADRSEDNQAAIYAAEKATLDEILPEAFAIVREAGKRTVGMRHFDVQLIGGIVLHSGK